MKRVRSKAVKPKKSKKRRTKSISIKVRRSSGRKEKFDLDRMARTTSRSGVPYIMARDIAKKVTKKVKSEARSKGKATTVTAGRLKNMIHTELKDRNQQSIASSYSGESPKNILEGESAEKERPVIGNTNVMHDRSKRLSSTA
jgi:transcriptional regulator NrdR family protein